MSITTIATVNINGFTAASRVGMLTEFLRRNEVDILFVQEVTNMDVLQIRGYETYQNNGTTCRGTAILAKRGIPLTNVRTIPSGRAIAAECR